MSSTKKIIVITNSFLLAAGVESLALEIRGLLVDEVFSGSEKKLCEKVLLKKPDLIIIDPVSLGEHLIPTLRTLREEPETVIAGLVSESMKENVKSKFSHQLVKDAPKYQLIEELQSIIGKSIQEENNKTLSKREVEILKNVVLGLSNKDIADKLFLSVHTVMTHRKKIARKLGIKTVSGLTVYALMNKIVDMREVERRT